MSIGTFSLVKNESQWIAAHILRIIPFVDEMVMFDGNSTDGTLEIMKEIKRTHPDGGRLRIFENEDPADLREDYTRVFNKCLRSVRSDMAWFAHPDFYVVNPEQILLVKDSPAIAMSTQMRSFGGEPNGQLYEIKGRCPDWKNIHRLHNPDLGAHYHGVYGHETEDVYFSAITGSKHELHEDLSKYPFQVVKSGIEVLHFSDVRPKARRLARMIQCLINNGWPEADAKKHATYHPRVTFESKGQFKFEPTEWPIEWVEARAKYKHLERSNLVHA